MGAKYNISTKKGDTFSLIFQIKNDSTAWNLTNYSVTMTVKPFIDSTTVTVSATTQNNLITLDALNGRVTINIPATTTANFPAGRHEYDIIFSTPSTVTTILEGKFIVTPGVTV